MLVMKTARGCGHCEYLRGNGIINNGKQLMSEAYVSGVLNKGIKFYNIHYSSMNGLNSEISSVSKMERNGDAIEQNIYFRNSSNKLSHTKYRLLNSKEQKLFTKTDENLHWNVFVREKIPMNLQGYVFYFPCFGMFKTDNWNECTKKNEQLMGILNLGYTVIDNIGNIYLHKDNKYLEKRKLSTNQLIDDVLSEKIKFEPVKLRDLMNGVLDDDDKKQTNIEQVNEQETKSKPEPVPKANSKILIMQY